jgi:tRNA(fMet)-specific endonuclease VapC
VKLAGRQLQTAKLSAINLVLAELIAADISADSVVDAYAELDAQSHRMGRVMGKNDLWIAAVARTIEGVVLTADADFSHLHPEWVEVELVDTATLRQGLA